MFSSQSAELSLEAPCRVVAAVAADRLDNRFLVGSSSVQKPNHLFACRFHAEVNELGLDAALPHPTGPIQSVACSPTDVTLAATSSQLPKSKTTLWKLPTSVMEDTGGMRYNDDEDEPGDNPNSDATTTPKATMEALSTLETTSGLPVTHMAWRQPPLDADASTLSASGDLLTVDKRANVQLWDVEWTQAVCTRDGLHEQPHSGRLPQNRSNKTTHNLNIGPRVAWDPHAHEAAAVTDGGSAVRILDWRSDQSIPVGTVDHFVAHGNGAAVVDLDYNPNKPYVLATAGTDGLLHFWDLRATGGGSSHQQPRPLLTCRGGHSHWISNVCYNPFHDQLVLSTGMADCVAHLWRLSSISSAPLLETTPHSNPCVAQLDHADAVYGAAWGAADAWVYTTVGYEGKVVLHHVPSKEKYKILL